MTHSVAISSDKKTGELSQAHLPTLKCVSISTERQSEGLNFIGWSPIQSKKKKKKKYLGGRVVSIYLMVGPHPYKSIITFM